MTTASFSTSKGAIRGLLIGLLLFLSIMAVSISTAPSASAAGCPEGTICDNNGDNGAPSPGIGTPNNPAPGSPGSPGAGTGPIDPYAFSIWNPGHNGGICAVRDDGKASLGFYTYMTYIFSNTESAEYAPDNSGWAYVGFFRAGSYGYHSWQKMIMTGTNCVYPPRTRIDNITCYISTTIELYQKSPKNRLVASKAKSSGYTSGSSNYDACVNSNSRVSFGSGLPDYGFYEIGNWSRVQPVSVEISLGPDPFTGVVPAPKIIGHGPVKDTAYRTTSTASLYCATGFESPGVWRDDWTDAPCINVSYFCPYSSSQIDVSDPGKKAAMNTFASGIQLMRDGKSRELRFGLGTINGSSITVTSHKTRFLRSGTPWDEGKTYSKNLFELTTSASATMSLLSYDMGGATGWQSGKVNSVFARGYYASDPGSSTRVTQEVKWSGYRTIRSGVVNSVDPSSGAVDYVPNYIQVPTTGICSKTAALEYLRPIGTAAG